MSKSETKMNQMFQTAGLCPTKVTIVAQVVTAMKINTLQIIIDLHQETKINLH